MVEDQADECFESLRRGGQTIEFFTKIARFFCFKMSHPQILPAKDGVGMITG